ncbi:MAG: toxin-antitoxin system, toxin component, HicA family protein [Clostridiales Family XIII bacterium]|jgi:mRNA interferase HicA|nr:toxin-antitoxin system, toxin component, HicA family protein [Clostridiales Family XIII bacterium]
MKRRDLVKLLEQNGWYKLRNGANHEIYTNGIAIEPVSWEREIPERVAQKIIKRRGLK